MDFFSPIEEDMVSRTEQDEDSERIAEQARKRAGDAGQVFAVVRSRSAFSLFLLFRILQLQDLTMS